MQFGTKCNVVIVTSVCVLMSLTPCDFVSEC